MTDIHCVNDLLTTLDKLFEDSNTDGESKFRERLDYNSLFTEKPDDLLEQYLLDIKPQHVLELGCGKGRNAIWMAGRGCDVDAIDLSNESIANAKQIASHKSMDVHFYCCDLLHHDFKGKKYDFIYDSGLFHHLLPHRRMQYVKIVANLLNPNGALGLVCFAPSYTQIGGAREMSDLDVYKEQTLQGGMAYSKERLVHILASRFELLTIDHMSDHSESDAVYGKSFLWSSVWKKK